MKNIFALTVLLITTITASAYDFEADGFYYNITDDTKHEVEVTNRSVMDASYSGECIIPTVVTYNDIQYFVTAIGNDAFFGCSALTSVTIPNSVTAINDNAFWYCTALTTVIIPSSVESIGRNVFSACSALTAITVETDNPNYFSSEGVLFNKDMTTLIQMPGGKDYQNYIIPNSVTAIGDYAYSDCKLLTTITIPNSITSIGKGAFAYCSALTTISIPSSVTSIGYGAFQKCSALKSITIPNTLTVIERSTFNDCSALTAITIPNSVKAIGSSAFDGCSALTTITIPNSVTGIVCKFHGCTALTAITVEADNPSYCSADGVLFDKDMKNLFRAPEGKKVQNYAVPNSVICITGEAFKDCSALKSITLPNSIISIFWEAFFNCTALEYISVGSEVRQIGRNAFFGCTHLKSFHVHSLEPPVCEDGALTSIDKSKCTLYVPEGSIDAYKAAPQWSEFMTILAEGTSGIDEVSDGGIDYSAPIEVYNLNGVKVADTLDGLPSGLYIVRQGSKVQKAAI